MSSISVIGSGNTASAIGALAVKGGNAVESLGLRPRDTGDLSMAHWLEGAGLLSVGVGRHGAGNYNFSLGVNFG
ncbi:MAG: hypothetical protein WA622_09830 [Mycobacterium sp.]|uniref:hypothetical protein n=1 Tax=Mycobacterium sp. TaxID=1785 RepID=UPI003BB748AD